MYLGMFLLRFIPVWDSLHFLDLTDYFLSHVRDVFDYILFKKFFLDTFFFSSSSGTPVSQMLVCLILSQRSLRLSSILFIIFPLYCSSAVISTILSSSSLIHSSASVIPLLIPFIFYFSNCVIHLFVYSLFILSPC